MPRIKSFTVTATSREEKDRFLEDVYLVRAEYGLTWPSDAVILAVNQAAHWIRFVRSYAGGVVIGPLDNCTEYTDAGGLAEAIEAARANALQDTLSYGIWSDDNDLIAIVSFDGELFVQGVAPGPYAQP